MKCRFCNICAAGLASPPSRGAWIEIGTATEAPDDWQSPPSRGAWIEITVDPETGESIWTSPPSRGAWIEICGTVDLHRPVGVAPLAGGVD